LTAPPRQRLVTPRPPSEEIEQAPPVQVYLPIAELTVNMLLFLSMGGAVGFLSGMFGVGGGFLLTPLLISQAYRRPWRSPA
jgi:uncharacterized membrane protein YfcA